MNDTEIAVLWSRYAETWSQPEDQRTSALLHCVTADVSYRDPHAVADGAAALSQYMGEFQRSVPGGRFSIGDVLAHHDRTLADWLLVGPDGATLQAGTSVADVSPDRRFRAITGFFRTRTA